MKKIILLLFITIVLLKSCQKKDENNKTEVNELDWWLQKNNDTLPSTNLQEAYHYITDKKGTYYPVTVAVLDTDIDINHKDIQPVLWRNTKETINDRLDNDNNGYIDDINGWNFIGTKDDGASLDFTLMEETRILRKYSKQELDDLYKKKKILFTYEDVKKSFDETVVSLQKKIKPYADAEPGYTWAMDTLKRTFNKDSFTLNELNLLQSKDTIIQQSIDYVKKLYNDGYRYKKFMEYLNFKRNSLNICMNLDYDNRELIGDNLEDIKDKKYGSPYISRNSFKINHGTKVSGVLTKLFNKLNEVTNKNDFFIMPLVVTGIGDPTDKDTALAIRYAVDNGARVINISQTKNFSINDKFVDEALCYADKKDVLIIKSAGNEGVNLDQNIRYPNDTNNKGKEIVENLIVVGAVTRPKKQSKKKILYKNTNYGKYSVDIYAPGSKINTLIPDNKYKRSSGTSYAAPIVAGVAALIRSYFPKLSAKQVKQILMDSGTSYAIEVEIKLEDGTKKLVPFSELSKSGKVVNAYNALLLAEKVSKGKK